MTVQIQVDGTRLACKGCGEPEAFGEIIAWSCLQDDGSFDPACQVIDRNGKHWFLTFDGPDGGCVLWHVDEDDKTDVEEQEIIPLFARCSHKPTPAA